MIYHSLCQTLLTVRSICSFALLDRWGLGLEVIRPYVSPFLVARCYLVKSLACLSFSFIWHGNSSFFYVFFPPLDQRNNAWDYVITDENGIGQGVYVLEQSLDAEVDWGIFGQWSWFQFSLQQTDGSPYKETLRLNPRQQDFKHSTVSEDIIPVQPRFALAVNL